MINKINFTGRETLLTKSAPKAKEVVNEYVSAGKIYSKEEIAEAKEMFKQMESRRATEIHPYSSPFAPTGNSEKPVEEFFMPETAPTKVNVLA